MLPFALMTSSGSYPPAPREASALLQYMNMDIDTRTRSMLKVTNRLLLDRSGPGTHVSNQLWALKYIFNYAMTLPTEDGTQVCCGSQRVWAFVCIRGRCRDMF